MTQLRSVLRAPLWALPLLASACFFDPAVPVDPDKPRTEIACERDAECPPDWLCNRSTARCVPTEARDSTPPALSGAPTVSPGIGTVGQVFVLEFAVSEALVEDPVVKLELGGATGAFALDPEGTDRAALRYRYRYTARGSEREGTRLITIDLVDTARNAVKDLSGGSLMLDFTPPRITSAAILPAVAAAGTEVQLELEPSEAVAAPPALSLVHPDGTSLPLVHVGASGTLGHRYAFTPDGGEPEGLYAVRATGADVAGNAFDYPQVAELTLDFTAPSVVTSQVLPTLAAAGQRVLVEIELNEALTSVGALVATPAASGAVAHTFTPLSSASTLLRFEHTVAPGSDGQYTLSLRDLVDGAGNTTAAIAIGTVEYDTTAPALVGYQQSHAVALAADTVTVRFSTTEVLGADPVVTLGGLAMQRVGGTTAPFAYTLAMAGSGLVGVQTVQVRLRDRVGNEALLQPGVVDVDAVPPALVDVVFTPPAARLGITGILTVTASEPLAASPTLRWAAPRGDPGFGYLGRAGLGHMWALEVTPAVSAGVYQVDQVSLTDLAGNVTVVDTSTLFALFDVDNLPPVLGVPVPDAALYSARAGHKTITVRVDGYDRVAGQANQPLAQLQVSMSGRTFVCGTYQASSPNYTCTYTVTGAEPEGFNIIAVRGVDAAGNETTVSAGVQLDFTAPTVGATSLILTPPSGCPLARVSAMGLGAAAALSFTVSEPLGTDPVVTVSRGSWTVAKNGTTSAGLFYEYGFALGGADASNQGAVSPQAVLTDLGGNVSAPLSLPTLTIDTVEPGPASVGTPDAVTYQRVPWGFDEQRNGTVSPSTYRVIGGVAAVDEDTAWVVAYDGPDANTAGLIGQQPASGGTFGTMRLNRADRTSVYVATFDRACNTSAPVQVRDVSWTATMGSKVPGSSTPNPHLYGATPVLASTRVQYLGAEADASQLQALGTVDGQALLRAAEASWQEMLLTTGTRPSVRSSHAMVYDSGRGKVVLFGGSTTTDLQDTWEWDGSSGTWTDRTPTGPKPSARWGHAMAYDSARGKVVLFGGQGGGSLQDTWEWDGTTGTWTDRTLAGARPSTRYMHGMVYDSGRGKMVVFGGNAGSGLLNDTWEWDGVTGAWAPRGSGSLPARYGHGQTYDSARGKVIVFGGQGNLGLLQDIWEWDGATGAWLDRTTAAARPAARNSGRLAYDAARDTVVLFGGSSSTGNLQDTWEWSAGSGTWTDRTPAGLKPGSRNLQALVYDSARGTVLMFGGYGGSWFQDSWEWDGARGQWNNRTPTGTRPSQRYHYGMAYDSGRGKVVLFGGTAGGGPFNDTWEWDGASGTWTFRGNGPAPARSMHALAWDSARSRVIMFGGHNGSTNLQDLWEWDGVVGTWTQRTPATSPPARSEFALASDSARGVVVLFGGNTGAGSLQDTWEWNGASATWTLRTPTGASPAARYRHAMAYDGARGTTVLFGGSTGTSQQDTWEWDGASGTWTQRTPAGVRPPARVGHAMAFDPLRGKVLLFGGSTSGSVADTWEWDGTSGAWADRTPAGARPPGRWAHTLVYDSLRARMVVFGGRGGTGLPLQDTWEWDGRALGKPAQTLQVSIAGAAVPPSSVVRSIQAFFVAGGIGYPAGTTTGGTDLLVWDEGVWQAVAANGDLASAPGAVEWTTTETKVLSRLLRGATLDFAASPAAPGGTGTGAIAVDYAEVTLRYRLP